MDKSDSKQLLSQLLGEFYSAKDKLTKLSLRELAGGFIEEHMELINDFDLDFVIKAIEFRLSNTTWFAEYSQEDKEAALALVYAAIKDIPKIEVSPGECALLLNQVDMPVTLFADPKRNLSASGMFGLRVLKQRATNTNSDNPVLAHQCAPFSADEALSLKDNTSAATQSIESIVQDVGINPYNTMDETKGLHFLYEDTAPPMAVSVRDLAIKYYDLTDAEIEAAGGDVYTAKAMQLYGVLLADVTKEQKDSASIECMRLYYGRSAVCQLCKAGIPKRRLT